jgi:DNA-binding transcriptional MerR regulator
MNHLYQEEIGIIKAQKRSGEYVDTLTLVNRIKEKKFTIKDIGVNYRWIDHWYSKGLLLSSYGEHKWKKFNLIEYVWLKIIIKMREFNLSLETIKSVKNIMDYDIMWEDINGSKDFNITEILPQIGPENLESETRELLRKKEILEKLKEFNMKQIEIIIMDILTFYNYYSILINPDGEIIPVKYSYLELYSDINEFRKLIKKSYVSISITEILGDFIIEKDIDLSNKHRIAILSEEESMVLNAIRREDLKSVIVRFDNENKMNLLEETKVETIDKASRLFELIMTNGYQDITIKTQNGEIVYCENKKKRLIQKKE